MCGICGQISFEKKTDPALVAQMNEALIHRGPDSAGFFNNDQVSLAMRRLKIVDLAHGDQPLKTPDQKLVLLFNGEIYNHIELRTELQKFDGIKFQTHSDGEPILYLYQKEGINFLKKLRGMFALVLYDLTNQKVIIARDRLSEKPLYYYCDTKNLFYSSELKSIRKAVAQDSCDPEMFYTYLRFQYIPEPHTPFKNIKKLPAGHYLEIDLIKNKASLQSYFELLDAKPLSENPEKRVRQELENLSPLIIRSDVPVGISLSGGIDSSAIAALAKKYSPTQLHAFSIGYEDRPVMDERNMAKKLATQLGLNYFEKEIKTSEVVKDFPKMVYYLDDPIGDIAAYGYFAVCQLAREHKVPVLLSGFGGDELFGGYFWTREALLRTKIKKTLRKFLPWIDSTYHFYEGFPGFKPSQKWIKQLGTSAFAEHNKVVYKFFPKLTDVASNISLKIFEVMCQTWLYSNCIALGDRMSMAHSIEMRLPLVDAQLVETVIGLKKGHPEEPTLPHKKWFIDAIKDLLPAEIFNRPKRGFTPPTQLWLKEIVKHYQKYLIDGFLVQQNLFNQNKILKFIEKAKDPVKLHFAYKLVLLELWGRMYVNGQRYQDLA